MTERDHAGIYVPPPLIYAIPFVAGLLLHRLVGHDALPGGWQTPAKIGGAVLSVAALAVTLVAAAIFAKAGTSVRPIAPTKAIVTRGPYRFTRNPMYVSMALLYVGLTLWLGYVWPLAFLPFAILAIDRYVIRREERYLEEKFGDEYRRYCGMVRRWI